MSKGTEEATAFITKVVNADNSAHKEKRQIYVVDCLVAAKPKTFRISSSCPDDAVAQAQIEAGKKTLRINSCRAEAAP